MLPTELDQNMFTRDAIMETMTGSKNTLHKPLVYSLPKNSKLEAVPHLTSVQEISPMQLKLVKVGITCITCVRIKTDHLW